MASPLPSSAAPQSEVLGSIKEQWSAARNVGVDKWFDVPEVYSGYLSRQSGLLKSWKRMWVVLLSDRLVYMATPNDAKPKGSIDLSTKTMLLQPQRGGKEGQQFTIVTEDRTHHTWQAISEAERDEWAEYVAMVLEQRKDPDLTINKTSPPDLSGLHVNLGAVDPSAARSESDKMPSKHHGEVIVDEDGSIRPLYEAEVERSESGGAPRRKGRKEARSKSRSPTRRSPNSRSPNSSRGSRGRRASRSSKGSTGKGSTGKGSKGRRRSRELLATKEKPAGRDRTDREKQPGHGSRRGGLSRSPPRFRDGRNS